VLEKKRKEKRRISAPERRAKIKAKSEGGKGKLHEK
jgi:hypothetical protein